MTFNYSTYDGTVLAAGLANGNGGEVTLAYTITFGNRDGATYGFGGLRFGVPSQAYYTYGGVVSALETVNYADQATCNAIGTDLAALSAFPNAITIDRAFLNSDLIDSEGQPVTIARINKALANPVAEEVTLQFSAAYATSLFDTAGQLLSSSNVPPAIKVALANPAIASVIQLLAANFLALSPANRPILRAFIAGQGATLDTTSAETIVSSFLSLPLANANNTESGQASAILAIANNLLALTNHNIAAGVAIPPDFHLTTASGRFSIQIDPSGKKAKFQSIFNTGHEMSGTVLAPGTGENQVTFSGGKWAVKFENTAYSVDPGTTVFVRGNGNRLVAPTLGMTIAQHDEGTSGVPLFAQHMAGFVAANPASPDRSPDTAKRTSLLLATPHVA